MRPARYSGPEEARAVLRLQMDKLSRADRELRQIALSGEAADTDITRGFHRLLMVGGSVMGLASGLFRSGMVSSSEYDAAITLAKAALEQHPRLDEGDRLTMEGH